MPKGYKIGLLTVALMIFSSLSFAAPIDYDEAVDGDLDQVNPPSFNLDVGDNCWAGSIGPTPTANTADVFSAVLPATMKITSIRWTYGANSGDVGTFGISGPPASGPLGTVVFHNLSGGAENILDTGWSDVNPILPVTATGSYNCSVTTGFNINGTSWKVTLTVEEIPVPVEAKTWGGIKAQY